MDNLNDKIMINIFNYMKEPLSDILYDQIISLSGNVFSDAITTQYSEIRESGRTSQFFSYDISNIATPIQQHILNCLGHLSANPSDKEKMDIITNVYVYASNNDSEDDRVINKNELSGKRFIDEAIKYSRNEWDYFMDKRGLINRNLLIIHGVRGTGKTFYLNHLLTKHNDYLDGKQVVWIRLNLARDFKGKKDGTDLIHWLRSKICLVILRYYYDTFIGLTDYLKEFINNCDISLRKDLMTNLEKINRIFHLREAKEALHHNLVEELIAVALCDYVIKKGYSFIFILDGFDKVDISPKYEDKFISLLDSLTNLLDTDTMLGGCFIIATRSETIDYMWDTTDYSFPTARPIQRHIKAIADVPFDKIIKKRLNYIIETGKKKLHYNKEDLDILIKQINDFKKYLENFTGQQNYISKLDNLYEMNHRAKVQLMQLGYYTNLFEGSKKYKLIEAMCKGGFKFPPAIYIYRNDNNRLIASFSEKIFDNVFMPIITRFPL